MADYKITDISVPLVSTGLKSLDKLTSGSSAYYKLIKPGIVYSNVMTGASGYLFASKLHVDLATMLAFLLGTGLCIASACIQNNYLDREIDRKMQRTKDRALAIGSISPSHAIILAFVAAAAGIFLLTFTNRLTLVLGILAIFSYVVVYGYAKRKSKHGTLVGTLPGATSLVAGYTAYSGKLDVTALLLFIIMVCWQMAHFYAIAVFRLQDYKKAHIPVWPAEMGIASTRRAIIFYILGFIAATIMLSALGLAGVSFAIITAASGSYWLWTAYRIRSNKGSRLWARQVFFTSLLVLLLMAAVLPISTLLP